MAFVRGVSNNHSLSMSFMGTKGLRNAPGDNNCFLNSAVQVLWHTDAFRRCFRQLSGHECYANSCIFCALKALFTQLQYSDRDCLQADVLRKALANGFGNQFDFGQQHDAVEVFENILQRLHEHVTGGYGRNEDDCKAGHCIPHAKFAMKVSVDVVCRRCGKREMGHSFQQLIAYVPTNALVRQSATDKYGLGFREAISYGDSRHCPAQCGGTAYLRRKLQNSPDIVGVGFVWDTDRPEQRYLSEVLRRLSESIYLAHLFQEIDSPFNNNLRLVGIVCYYGKHYTSFCLHTSTSKWVHIDDANVVEIGDNFDAVLTKCIKDQFQPLLLIYANPTASPLDVSKAPSLTKKIETPSDKIERIMPKPEIKPKPTVKGRHTRQPSFIEAVEKRNEPFAFKSNWVQEFSNDEIDLVDSYIAKSNVQKVLDAVGIGRKKSECDSADDNSSTSGYRTDSSNCSSNRSSNSSTTTNEESRRNLLENVRQHIAKMNLQTARHSLASSTDSLLSNVTLSNTDEVSDACVPIDELLTKSNEAENHGDTSRALTFCNEALTECQRALQKFGHLERQFLNPLENRQTTCVIRSNSLSIKMEQRRSPSPSHVRQSSSSSTLTPHSRGPSLSSLDTLDAAEDQPSSNVYGTLPKNGETYKNFLNKQRSEMLIINNGFPVPNDTNSLDHFSDDTSDTTSLSSNATCPSDGYTPTKIIRSPLKSALSRRKRHHHHHHHHHQNKNVRFSEQVVLIAAKNGDFTEQVESPTQQIDYMNYVHKLVAHSQEKRPCTPFSTAVQCALCKNADVSPKYNYCSNCQHYLKQFGQQF